MRREKRSSRGAWEKGGTKEEGKTYHGVVELPSEKNLQLTDCVANISCVLAESTLTNRSAIS